MATDMVSSQRPTFRWLNSASSISFAIAALAIPPAIVRPVAAATLSSWSFDAETEALVVTVGAGVTPQYFLMANPARIVLDLPNTSLGAVPTTATYGGVVRSIRVAEFQPGQTRIVLELAPATRLAQPQAELRSLGNDQWSLRPRLQGEAAPAPVAQVTTSEPPVPEVAATASTASPSVSVPLPPGAPPIVPAPAAESTSVSPSPIGGLAESNPDTSTERVTQNIQIRNPGTENAAIILDDPAAGLRLTPEMARALAMEQLDLGIPLEQIIPLVTDPVTLAILQGADPAEAIAAEAEPTTAIARPPAAIPLPDEPGADSAEATEPLPTSPDAIAAMDAAAATVAVDRDLELPVDGIAITVEPPAGSSDASDTNEASEAEPLALEPEPRSADTPAVPAAAAVAVEPEAETSVETTAALADTVVAAESEVEPEVGTDAESAAESAIRTSMETAEVLTDTVVAAESGAELEAGTLEPQPDVAAVTDTEATPNGATTLTEATSSPDGTAIALPELTPASRPSVPPVNPAEVNPADAVSDVPAVELDNDDLTAAPIASDLPAATPPTLAPPTEGDAATVAIPTADAALNMANTSGGAAALLLPDPSGMSTAIVPSVPSSSPTAASVSVPSLDSIPAAPAPVRATAAVPVIPDPAIAPETVATPAASVPELAVSVPTEVIPTEASPSEVVPIVPAAVAAVPTEATPTVSAPTVSAPTVSVPTEAAPTPSTTGRAATPPPSSPTAPTRVITFGEPVQSPAASTAIAGSSPASATPSPSMAAATQPLMLLSADTVLSLQYPREQPLEVNPNLPWQEVLLVAEAVPTATGQIIPVGTPVIGRFEMGTSGSRFIAQAIALDGYSVQLLAESEQLEGDREVSRDNLLRNSGIGAAATVVGGALTGGIGLIAGAALGAATGAATTYVTTPNVTVIQPYQVIQVRIVEDVPYPAIGGMP